MARTLNTTLPIYGYGVTSYTYTNAHLITFNLSLSAETASSLVGYLSGNATVSTPTLSAVLAPATGNLTLSARSTPVYFWGSNAGGTSLYGYLTNSTFTSGTSSFVASIQFGSPDFVNTVITLSGNSATNNIVVYSTSVTDNPVINRGSGITDANGINQTFRSVANHQRLWNLNG